MFVEFPVNSVGIRIKSVTYLSIWSRLRNRFVIADGVLGMIGTETGVAAGMLLINLGTVATKILLVIKRVN